MDFIAKRKIAYILSCLVIIAGIISMCFQGLNFGIDFTGGTVMQVKFEKSVDIADLRSDLKEIGHDNAQIQELGDGVFQIRADYMDQTAQDKFTKDLSALTGKLDVLQANAVGPSIGKEILRSGILALIIALVLMVFDRIRERIGSVKRENLANTVNNGIQATLKRSLLTSISTLIPLFAVLLFGGATTKLFVLAIIIGIVSGTYSSIFVASPLWYDFSMKSKKKRF